MSSTPVSGVLVGVDGSPVSFEAARWAAAEASSQQVSLTIAYVVPQLAEFDPGDFLPEETEAAKRLVEGLAERFRGEFRELEVHTVVRAGLPADELVAIAANASLIVLGARGHGGFPELLLGSVSAHVADHAPCPTVVVRDGSQPGPDAPIVVGEDGTPQSHLALEHAFATADRLHAPLTVIRTYPVHPVVSLAGVPHQMPTTGYETGIRQALADTLRPLVEKYPNVPVRQQVSAGSASAAIVEASRRARLVVVGSRGRTGMRVLLLGSVSRQVLHHTHSPVAIIH